MHFSDDQIDVVIIIVRLQSVRKSRLFLPSASTALPASWSADWGARAARPISSCPPTPCPHTQPSPPPPCILLLLLPILPPSFPVLESPCAVDPLQLHMSSHLTLLSFNFPFSASLLFTQKSCSAFPSKQRGASVRRGETKSYLSPSSNTLQPKISLPTP